MSTLFAADEAEKLLDAAVRGEMPDDSGRFGPFGGRYVPETLVPAFDRLEQGVREHLHDPAFQAEFQKELREWVGRPTALTFAPQLSEAWGAEVNVKTTSGDSFKIARKHCRGDPELALDADEMRIKALDLLRYGGFDEARANALCDDVLSLPSSRQTPRLFSNFMHHIGVSHSGEPADA